MSDFINTKLYAEIEDLKDVINARDARIDELEKELFINKKEANKATHRAISIILERDARIAELGGKNL